MSYSDTGNGSRLFKCSAGILFAKNCSTFALDSPRLTSPPSAHANSDKLCNPILPNKLGDTGNSSNTKVQLP